jgi:ribosomal protein S18 acetylase RimI-like enzyme
MTFQIEQLGLEELSAFLCLQAEDSFPDLKDEERLKMLAEKWSKYAECSTCRTDEGLLVGMIAFYANGQGTDFAYIPHVYVSLEYRQQGLFGKMLRMMEAYVKQKGYTEIKLEVNNDNVIAKNSYLRQGFVENMIASEETIYMIKTIM